MKMKIVRRITTISLLCLVFAQVITVGAQEVLDPDYSAAMLRVMGEGGQVDAQLVEDVAQTVQELAVEKDVYTTDVLSVRARPGTEYEAVAMLAQYAKVHVIAVCDNGWSRIQMEDGQQGYVKNEYISDVVPEGAKNIGESLGVYTITYYCSCADCCGYWSGGPTASGSYPVADWTVAADPDVLPLGTHIYINGHEYCVEDTGSGVEGQHIDIYVSDHQLAVNNGITAAEIFASKS